MKKQLLKFGLVSVLLLSILCSMCACGKSSVGENDYDVNGCYKVVISGNQGNDTTIQYDFNKADMTFSETLTAGEMSSEILKGTYEVDVANDKVICTSESGEVSNFIIYGQFIIAEGYVYRLLDSEEFPEGKTFDLIVGYELNGSASGIQFTKDGNFLVTDGTSGTYERDGYMIKRTASDGSVLVDLLICEGGVTNAYFEKTK